MHYGRLAPLLQGLFSTPLSVEFVKHSPIGQVVSVSENISRFYFFDSDVLVHAIAAFDNEGPGVESTYPDAAAIGTLTVEFH